MTSACWWGHTSNDVQGGAVSTFTFKNRKTEAQRNLVTFLRSHTHREGKKQTGDSYCSVLFHSVASVNSQKCFNHLCPLYLFTPNKSHYLMECVLKKRLPNWICYSPEALNSETSSLISQLCGFSLSAANSPIHFLGTTFHPVKISSQERTCTLIITRVVHIVHFPEMTKYFTN